MTLAGEASYCALLVSALDLAFDFTPETMSEAFVIVES